MATSGVKTYEEIYQELLKLNDAKKGQIFSKLMNEMPEPQRLAFIGELTKQRYINNGKITEVYRNVGYAPNTLIMQIAKAHNYPGIDKDAQAFLRLVKAAKNNDEKAKQELKEQIDKFPEPMVKALSPMYKQFMSDVDKETKERSIEAIKGHGDIRCMAILKKAGIEVKEGEDIAKKASEYLNKLSPEEVKKIRKEEAKIAFMGSVVFAFIEQSAMDLEDKQLASELQTELRALRNQDISAFSGIIDKLDSFAYEAPTITEESKSQVTECFGKIDDFLKKVEESKSSAKKELMGDTENPGIALYLHNICAAVKSGTEAEQKEFDARRSEFSNIFDRLNVKYILKGLEIPVEEKERLLREAINKPINGKSLYEHARESGLYTPTELKKLSDNIEKINEGRIDYNNPKQAKMLREICEVNSMGAAFALEDTIEQLKKTPIDQLNDKIFDAYSKHLVSDASPDFEINWGPQDIRPELLEKIKNKNLSPEEAQEVIGVFSKIAKKERDLSIMSSESGSRKDFHILKNQYPLHTLAAQKGYDLDRKISTSDITLLDIILKHSNIDEKNIFGKTALQIASENGNKDLVQKLIDNGANPKITSTNYQRSTGRRLLDTIGGLFSGKGLKHWNIPPERTLKSIAKISGQKDMVQILDEAEKNWQPKEDKVEKQKDSLSSNLNSENEDITASRQVLKQLEDVRDNLHKLEIEQKNLQLQTQRKEEDKIELEPLDIPSTAPVIVHRIQKVVNDLRFLKNDLESWRDKLNKLPGEDITAKTRMQLLTALNEVGYALDEVNSTKGIPEKIEKLNDKIKSAISLIENEKTSLSKDEGVDKERKTLMIGTLNNISHVVKPIDEESHRKTVTAKKN